MDQKEAVAIDAWGLLDSTGERELTVWVHGEYYVQRRGSPVASKNVYRYTDDGMLQISLESCCPKAPAVPRINGGVRSMQVPHFICYSHPSSIHKVN
jgi:hypothetical protein